jgi:hypothetical protein
MRAALFRLTLLGLASASLLSACADFDSGESVEDAGSARIIRSKTGALTPPTTSHEAAAREFAASHGIAVDQLKTMNNFRTARGSTLVKFEQFVNGIRVYDSYAKASFDSQGQLIQLIDGTRKIRGDIKTASIDSSVAVSKALTELGFESGDAFHRAPSAEDVIYVDDAGVARRGYEVESWSVKGNQLNYTLIGGDGKLVRTELRTANDKYNVFTEDPIKTPQAEVAGPGAGNTESPSGWLGTGAQTTVNITGNNAHAYLDADANNAPDAGGTAVTDGQFLTAANLAQAPTTTGNKNVAVQNLFYFNNVVHDTLYRHGFNEAAGNFQVNNFGKGGAGNDPVNAEAQDGSGTDNANFSTPNDGSSPRMQMYLWSSYAPNVDVTVSGVKYGAYQSGFGPAFSSTNAPLAAVNDGVAAAGGGTTTDGCESLAPGSLTGKVAVLDRGFCDFTVKVANAQSAGAVAVLIANNADTKAFGPGGTNRKIKIPSGMVSKTDGSKLRALAGSTANIVKAAAGLQIDGDIDSDIVFHEFGHGLTWRMVGSMSGAFAGAIGEGASDTVAFLINEDDLVGEYAYGDGIRRYPYEGYPLTYSSWTGAEVHDDGEIYAAAMWKVYQNYLAANLTASDVLDDFVEGLNHTPAGPTPEQMRDGMLQGAPASRACLIWRGFAAQGIGVGAKGVLGRRGTVSVTQSFTLPSGC